MKSGQLYPPASRELTQKRNALGSQTAEAFDNFSKAAFKDGALPEKTKHLIAIAVAHVTQCPYCIRSHTRKARQMGATPQEIMEAIYVAAEMRAGAAIAHSNIALDEMEE